MRLLYTARCGLSCMFFSQVLTTHNSQMGIDYLAKKVAAHLCHSCNSSRIAHAVFTENCLFKMSTCHKYWSKVSKKLLKEATNGECMHVFQSSWTVHSSKTANYDMARKLSHVEQKTWNKLQFQNINYLRFEKQTWQRKIFLFATKKVNFGKSYEKNDQHHIYGKSNHCASICGVLSFSFLSREGRKTKWNINIKTWWLIKKKECCIMKMSFL